MERVSVCVHSKDGILKAGITSHLRHRPEVRVLSGEGSEAAEVSLVAVDVVNDDVLQLLRRIQRVGRSHSVLVVGHLDDTDVVAAIEAGVIGLLRRCEATADNLVQAVVRAAANDGTVPPDLLGRLLTQIGELQRGVLAPRGLSFTGLASREVEVLRLVAEGCDTAEIADRLAYSERTVKNVLHDVTTRLQLRNRSHAVAYAVREGFI